MLKKKKGFGSGCRGFSNLLLTRGFVVGVSTNFSGITKNLVVETVLQTVTVSFRISCLGWNSLTLISVGPSLLSAVLVTTVLFRNDLIVAW